MWRDEEALPTMHRRCLWKVGYCCLSCWCLCRSGQPRSHGLFARPRRLELRTWRWWVQCPSLSSLRRRIWLRRTGRSFHKPLLPYYNKIWRFVSEIDRYATENWSEFREERWIKRTRSLSNIPLCSVFPAAGCDKLASFEEFPPRDGPFYYFRIR